MPPARYSSFENPDASRKRSLLLFPALLISFQSSVESLLRNEKRCLLKFDNGRGKVDQILFGSDLQNCDGENRRDTETARTSATVTIVHEDSVCPTLQCKLQRLRFTAMQ